LTAEDAPRRTGIRRRASSDGISGAVSCLCRVQKARLPDSVLIGYDRALFLRENA